MNESATLRFEFVASGGSGPGPAGLPAPTPQTSPNIPAPSSPGSPAMSAKRPESVSPNIDAIRALLQQTGIKNVLPGPAGAVTDGALALAGKFEGVLSALRGAGTGAATAARAALPIAGAGGGAAAGGVVAGGAGAVGAGAGAAGLAGAASLAIPIAGAVVGSAAFAGLLAKMSYDFAESRIKEYSPDVAVANAMAEVRTINRNLALSSRLGNETADIIDATSKIGDDIIEILTPWMEQILGFTGVVTDGISIFTALAAEINELLPGFPDLTKDAREMLQALRRLIRQEEAKSVGGLIAAFNNFKHLKLPPGYRWTGGIPVTVGFNGPVMWNP